MKYYEVDFNVLPLNSDATDLLAALAGEAGFETFEETDCGLKGYVQQPMFDRSLLDSLLQTFPMPGVTVSYTVGEAEDRDWNEQWEQQGFEPIVVADRLIIHDGRHLPTSTFFASKASKLERNVQPSTFNVLCKQSEQARAQPSALNIEIDARQAFGTGTHETTRMVCATLLELDVQGQRVLDCGSGTGILGITAMKLGARECVAYDIDEWSVDNTRHNAVINRVEITPLLGDATILNKVKGTFDIVMANINRNILLADMPMFRQKMAPGAHLILSGFYTADIPLLTDRAASLGLALISQREAGDWACLLFSAAAS